MKRIGNIFGKIVDIENLMKAHKNARKDKSFYAEVQRVDKEPMRYLEMVRKELIEKTYRVSEYDIFEKRCEDKVRKIYKLPYFPDRIVQWAIMLQIQERIDKHLIKNTYSAIPGRGIHKALLDVNRALKNYPEQTRYCVKLDVRKYYPSINQKILMVKLRKVIKCKETLEFIEKIVTSLPESEGIPIGSYLSQYFGNYYLSELDHYCKEKLKCKFYYRYMDDIVVLGATKEEVWKVFYEIKDFLEKDELEVKGNYKVFPVDIQGLDFVGYRFFRNRIIARKSIFKKLRKRMNFLREVKRTKKQESSFQSYNGWLKWTTCTEFKRRVLNEI